MNQLAFKQKVKYNNNTYLQHEPHDSLDVSCEGSNFHMVFEHLCLSGKLYT